MRLGDALSPALLGREAIQLGVLAALSLAAYLFAPRWLQVVAFVVDVGLALVAGAALLVAWRNARRGPALALYGAASVIFTLLAVLNVGG
jgi:hypothetical protein